jgi:2-amino-4-hydroxy-6-hydroxymethyldihydropteridine diphosphokinase
VTRVYVSIGSNIDPERNVRGALAALESRFGPLLRSTIYESEPVGFEGSNFYNLVIGFDTDLDVDTVQSELADIEDGFGRQRGSGDSSRTLDLDLLLFGDLVRRNGARELPRRDIENYAFVLRPLAELAPDTPHPGTGRTFRQMWKEFQGSQLLWPVELDTGRRK